MSRGETPTGERCATWEAKRQRQDLQMFIGARGRGPRGIDVGRRPQVPKAPFLETGVVYREASCEGRPHCEVKLQRYMAKTSEGRRGVARTGISPGLRFWHPFGVHEVGSPSRNPTVLQAQALEEGTMFGAFSLGLVISLQPLWFLAGQAQGQAPLSS